MEKQETENGNGHEKNGNSSDEAQDMQLAIASIST